MALAMRYETQPVQLPKATHNQKPRLPAHLSAALARHKLNFWKVKKIEILRKPISLEAGQLAKFKLSIIRRTPNYSGMEKFP